jgi:hypothetical protein
MNFIFLNVKYKENNHVPGEERVLCARVFVYIYIYFISYGSTALYGPGPPRVVEVS